MTPISKYNEVVEGVFNVLEDMQINVPYEVRENVAVEYQLRMEKKKGKLCSAITLKGLRCSRHTKGGDAYCGQHMKKYADIIKTENHFSSASLGLGALKNFNQNMSLSNGVKASNECAVSVSSLGLGGLNSIKKRNIPVSSLGGLNSIRSNKFIASFGELDSIKKRIESELLPDYGKNDINKNTMRQPSQQDILNVMNEESLFPSTDDRISGQEDEKTMIKKQVPNMVMKTLKLYAQMFDFGKYAYAKNEFLKLQNICSDLCMEYDGKLYHQLSDRIDSWNINHGNDITNFRSLDEYEMDVMYPN